MNKKKVITSLFVGLLVGAMLIISSCQQDDNVNDNLQEAINTTSHSSISTVNAMDIPEVMEYLRSQLDDGLTVTMEVLSGNIDGQNRSQEPDLVIGEVQLQEIKKATNSYGRSNYAFNLSTVESSQSNSHSIFNYVVKETQLGIYGLIIEYRLDKNWLGNPDIDYRTYTGDVIVYNETGSYIGKNVKEDGITISDHFRGADPCPPNDNTSGGGSTSGDGSGAGPGTGSTTSGTGGDAGGTGGSQIDIEIICGCSPDHPGGSESDDCNCTEPDTIIVTIHKAATQESKPFTNRCPDPVESCAGENDCEYGYDEFCGCLPPPEEEEEVENDEVPINIDISGIALISNLNDYLEPDLNDEQIDWIFENDENRTFAEYALEILRANPEANPLLGADCRSFEYAQPPGALQKGCAVTDFNHTFYTAGVRPNGSPYYGEIDSNIDIIYFTTPTFLTNGQAANLTAIAVTDAIKETDLYFFENPDISQFDLGDFFRDRLIANMALIGGTVSTSVEPFSIPSPAPYITSILGLSNPFDC